MINVSSNIIHGDLLFPCQFIGNVTEPHQFADKIYQFLIPIKGQMISPQDFAQGIFEAFTQAGNIFTLDAIQLLDHIIVFFTYNVISRPNDEVKHHFLALLNQPNTSSF